MAEVKICGVSDAAGMDAVAASGAEWVGFNFFPPSPRFVTVSGAAALAVRHKGGPRAVGLFVDASDEVLAEAVAAVPFAALQIHAGLARAAEIERRFGVPVWWAVGVAGADDLPATAAGVSRVLLDAKAPPGAVLPGGNAAPFDWDVLRGWAAPVPWVLAGGLTPGTVGAAVAATGAAVVDVASGVERVRGVKDAGLIAAFVAAAREASIGGRDEGGMVG